MLNPIVFQSPRLCHRCNKKTIEIFNIFGARLGYDKILERKEQGYPDAGLDKYAVTKMKCLSCGQLYNIIWVGGFPYPDYNHIKRKDHFINLFTEKENSK